MREAIIRVELSTGGSYRLGTLHYDDELEPNKVLWHLAQALRATADDLEQRWIVPDHLPEGFK